MKAPLMKYLSLKSLDYIGYSYIYDEFSPITPYGIKEKSSLHLYHIGEEKELSESLKIVYSLKSLMEKNIKSFAPIELCLMELKDITLVLRKLKEGICLDEIEFFELKKQLIALVKLKALWDNSFLKDIIFPLAFADLSKALRLLDPDKLSLPTFFVYDSYSEALKNIRERKKALEKRLLAETEAEALEELKAMRGLVVSEELEEELRIREELTTKLQASALEIENNIKLLTKVDLYLAKARLAILANSTLPYIKEGGAPRLKGAINPFIERQLSKRGLSFTPITIDLAEGPAVITGANMGGKTVAIKTMALNILLVHLGFLPFCEAIELPLLDYIYLNSEESQDTAKSLSSFTGEIIALKEVLDYGKAHKGLLLLDEFARGTNPQEGMVLCSSLTEYLKDNSIISVIATHYNGVAEKSSVHYQCIGLKKVSEETLNKALLGKITSPQEIIQGFMDYSLEKANINSKVPEEALKLCRLLNFNKDILAKASKEYNQGDF
ncbi:MutS-related protein [Alloiococcus sp. CFN-8]|uniref:lysine 5,6-aminomutase reactivase ATPase KamC n=1 Tax=Alloiococcus sp. CFN-8 TaxID=3416081 RepID=UPI003CE9878C